MVGSSGCHAIIRGANDETRPSRVLLLLASQSPAWATWSVIAVDKKTGQVIIASATCVEQARFAARQPTPARDPMDVQAVIVPGVGVAACQAAADNTRCREGERGRECFLSSGEYALAGRGGCHEEDGIRCADLPAGNAGRLAGSKRKPDGRLLTYRFFA